MPTLLIGVLASLALLLPFGSAGAAPAASHIQKDWIPKISIVWPNTLPLVESTTVNVSVWPANPVPCDQPPKTPLRLWRAVNNEPAEPVVVEPQMFLRLLDHPRTFVLRPTTFSLPVFPSLEFNDVAANLAADPASKFRFVIPNASNVWVHAIDPRTFLPQQVVPTGHGSLRPKQIDARIQVVWPHDEQGNPAPVDRAPLVNIAVDLFEHSTLTSVPPEFPAADFPANIVLFGAEVNGNLSQTVPGTNRPWGTPQKTTYTVGGNTFPRWVFNDVPVKPGTQYHFLVSIQGNDIQTFPSIWTHAPDARTFLPQPQPPDYGGQPAEFHCMSPTLR